MSFNLFPLANIKYKVLSSSLRESHKFIYIYISRWWNLVTMKQGLPRIWTTYNKHIDFRSNPNAHSWTLRGLLSVRIDPSRHPSITSVRMVLIESKKTSNIRKLTKNITNLLAMGLPVLLYFCSPHSYQHVLGLPVHAKTCATWISGVWPPQNAQLSHNWNCRRCVAG